MGGRANAGNTKLFSNVDAARNAHLRATRTKEIETNRAAKPVQKPARGTKKVLETPGSYQGEYVKEGGRYVNNRFVGPSYEKRTISSYARTSDGRLHAAMTSRGVHPVTDASSGRLVNAFGSKKEAVGFLNAVTRKDGRVSPTFERALASASGEDQSAKGRRAQRALVKIIERYDSNRRALKSSGGEIKSKVADQMKRMKRSSS